MDKSNILINYRCADNMTDQEKYMLNLQIQLEVSKLMRKFVDEKKISVFHTGDNDYVEDILNEEYKRGVVIRQKVRNMNENIAR